MISKQKTHIEPNILGWCYFPWTHTLSISFDNSSIPKWFYAKLFVTSYDCKYKSQHLRSKTAFCSIWEVIEKFMANGRKRWVIRFLCQTAQACAVWCFDLLCRKFEAENSCVISLFCNWEKGQPQPLCKRWQPSKNAYINSSHSLGFFILTLPLPQDEQGAWVLLFWQCWWCHSCCKPFSGGLGCQLLQKDSYALWLPG